MQVARFTEGQNDFASNLRKLNLKFTLGNLVLVAPIAIFISLLYQPYMQTLFGGQYNPNYTLLWSILCGRIIYTTYSTLYLSLSTPSKVNVFTRLGIYIGLLNILFSCLLMQSLPLIGPAIGTAIASLIGIAVILLVNHRESAMGASS